VTTRYGYTLSSEEHAPNDLVEQAASAEDTLILRETAIAARQRANIAALRALAGDYSLQPK